MRLVYNSCSNLLLFRGKCFYITKIANNSVGFSCLDFPVFALPSDALKGVEDLRSWEEEWKECRMKLPYKPSTMEHLIFLITICVISLWTLYFGPITFAILPFWLVHQPLHHTLPSPHSSPLMLDGVRKRESNQLNFMRKFCTNLIVISISLYCSK